MELEECDIQEFKRICAEELGLKLSDAEAAEEARRFFNFMKAILS